MAKQSLLVADADPRSLRILDVALRKAGFQVSTASDGAEALRRLQRTPPDLLLADLGLPGTDGLALCKAARADAKLAGMPVILISSSKDPALKLSAHEAGADDFLGKPLLIKELTARIRMLLTRREQQKISQRGGQSTVTGEIGEMGLVDLIQSLDSNRQSANISCEDGERTGQIWVRDGQVVDAEAGALAGEAAFYRVLGWEAGKFTAALGPVEREAKVEQGTQALLAESVRRVDELGRLSEELPLSTVLAVDFPQLARRLADLPDEVNGVIRLCDGIRTIQQVMERAPIDELSVLAVLQRLLNEQVLLRSEPVAAPKSKPSLMQWLGPDSVATPAPPIMGAHGFPQSGDPTPIAPPVSDPPLPSAPAAAAPASPRASADSPRLLFDTPADPMPAGAFAVAPADAAPVPQPGATPPQGFRLPVDAAPVPQPGATPPQGFRLPASTAAASASDVTPPHAFPAAAEAAPAPAPAAAPPSSSVPPPVHTDLFKLPTSPRAPVPLVRFAPLRGVRRERLRREAEEARARVAEGKPVRLTHVVELPSYPSAPPDPRRRISPAVGEAAKKFAPDLALGAKEAAAVAPEPEPLPLEPISDSEPGMEPLPAMDLIEPPSLTDLPAEAASEPAALPAKDDRDAFGESATMQVEPLSSESLAPAAPASLSAPAPVAVAPLDAPAPAVVAESEAALAPPAASAAESTASGAIAPAPPAAAELPAGPPPSAAEGAGSAAPSPWDESTDPLAAAPSAAQITSPGQPLPAADEPLAHDAPTAPGHRIDIPVEAASPVAALAVAPEPAPARDTVETTPVSAPAPASSLAADAAPAASSDEAIETAPLPPLAEAPAPLAEPRELSAAAITAESAPLKLPAPSARTTEDDEFDAEMRAALGKNKRRWPLYAGLAAAAVALIIYFRPQPPTDKKDSPWLEGQGSAQPAQPAPTAAPATPLAPAPVVAPDAGEQQASAADAGPALAGDAGALAAVTAPAPAPSPAVDAGPEIAASPVNDDYARALAAGESLLKRGKYNSAVAELTRAVKINPEAVPALLELGDAWLESDKPRSALKPLEKAIKLDPRSSRAQLLYGTALQSLGKNAEAVKAYQRYLEMDPAGEYARDVRSILANLQK